MIDDKELVEELQEAVSHADAQHQCVKVHKSLLANSADLIERQAAELEALKAERDRLAIRGQAYEDAFRIAYSATYQSHARRARSARSPRRGWQVMNNLIRSIARATSGEFSDDYQAGDLLRLLDAAADMMKSLGYAVHALNAELEALRKRVELADMAMDFTGFEAMHAELEALRAERDALRADAERWRFECIQYAQGEFAVPYWERELENKQSQDKKMDAARAGGGNGR